MIHSNIFKASAVPFMDQAKLAALKLKARSVLATGTSHSKRVQGTLHLPVFTSSR
jgi:hypothetical protein